MQRNERLEIIGRKLRDFYRHFDTANKELAADYYYQCIACLKTDDIRGAYTNYKAICHLTKLNANTLDKLLLPLVHSEDFIDKNAFVLINAESPFYKSLKVTANKLGFEVHPHKLSEGRWTKDFIISTGEEVFFPATEKKQTHLLGATKKPSVKDNAWLYYEKLKMKEHHAAKTTIQNAVGWQKRTKDVLSNSTPLKHTALEGGNFFCAINNKGQKYFLIGENVLSETMLYHKIDRKSAIGIIAKDFGCESEKLLIIPQWTYHLDLQMAYLGQGQFILHSFDQQQFDFNLSKDELEKSKKTFEFLRQQFENDIVDKVFQILKEHDFSVSKVFGCLFYLNDIHNKNELRFVPFCKSSEGCDGALAFLMNGIAAVAKDEKYFLTSRCENQKFKEQFEKSLAKFGRKVEYIDMLDFYDDDGSFDNILSGVMEAHSVGDYIAFMNGGLRCQTSVLNKSAMPQFREIPRSFLNRYDLAHDQTAKDLHIKPDHEVKLKKK